MESVGRDEKVLLDVRNKALTKAQERFRFLGRKEDAVKMGKLLVELNPERNYEYLKELGVSYLIMGKNGPAEEIFRQMLNVDPSDGWANVHLGFAVKARVRNRGLHNLN